MKIASESQRFNLSDKLVVAFDISKDYVDAYCPFARADRHLLLTDRVRNRSNVLRGALMQYRDVAASSGLSGVHVCCEPTGGYQLPLLRAAHQLGFTSSYVNPEAVHKLRIVLQNDTGKTDLSDPKVVHHATVNGRPLEVRQLEGPYEALNTLNRIYEQVSDACMRCRCQIEKWLFELFPDFSLKLSRLYSNTGAALVEAFGCNPHRIRKAGWDRFQSRMRRRVPGIYTRTLKKLWHDAVVSCHQLHSTRVIELKEQQLVSLYRDWQRHAARKEELRTRLLEQFRQTVECEKLSDTGISQVLLARVVGETGPLAAFAGPQQLLRFAGLKIRERKSGRYKGQNRITKKGNSLLRKVLYQVVFRCLAPPEGLLSEYYRRKKDDLKVGAKAMVAAMRKLLLMLRGICLSPWPFDASRIHASEAQYVKAG